MTRLVKHQTRGGRRSVSGTDAESARKVGRGSLASHERVAESIVGSTPNRREVPRTRPRCRVGRGHRVRVFPRNLVVRPGGTRTTPHRPRKWPSSRGNGDDVVGGPSRSAGHRHRPQRLIRLTSAVRGGFLHTVRNRFGPPTVMKRTLNPAPMMSISSGSFAPMHGFHASAAGTTTYSWPMVSAAKPNTANTAFAAADTKRSPQRFGEPLT